MRSVMRILVPVGFVSVFVLALALNTRYCCQASVTEEELKNWPLPCYQGEKLNELRNWERTWAGQRINQDSIDQVKAFLSEEYYPDSAPEITDQSRAPTTGSMLQ